MVRRGIRTSVIVAAAVVGLSGSAAAMYTPNPTGRWAPGRFFLAGDFSFIADKDLDGRPREANDLVGFFVRPAYSIASNVMVYGRIGFQDGDNFDSGFAGGGGIQAAYVLPRAEEWAIGGSFDFMHWDTGRPGGDVDWDEFQFAPAVSYNIPQRPEITPYAGLVFDFLAGDVDEDDPVGMLFGANIDLVRRVRFDLQFRVVNETGFLASAGYLF
jgi:hypothetical protein